MYILRRQRWKITHPRFSFLICSASDRLLRPRNLHRYFRNEEFYSISRPREAPRPSSPEQEWDMTEDLNRQRRFPPWDNHPNSSPWHVVHGTKRGTADRAQGSSGGGDGGCLLAEQGQVFRAGCRVPGGWLEDHHLPHGGWLGMSTARL